MNETRSRLQQVTARIAALHAALPPAANCKSMGNMRIVAMGYALGACAALAGTLQVIQSMEGLVSAETAGSFRHTAAELAATVSALEQLTDTYERLK